MCVSSSKFSQEQKCIYIPFCSHPTLLPSYKEAFAPILDYSGPNPCFVPPQSTPLQALKRKGRISYTEKCSSLSSGNGWHVLPLLPHTCISCSSGRLNILLPRAHFPGDLKGWSVGLHLPCLYRQLVSFLKHCCSL